MWLEHYMSCGNPFVFVQLHVFIKVKTPDAAIRDANASANPSVVAGG
jgi:hypothetical protein